jgi:flagellar hook assembly protein FlgD
MNTRAVLILILFICLQALSVNAAEIVIKDADTVWSATPEFLPDLKNTTSNMPARILAEYANSIAHINLRNVPQELTTEAAKVQSRIMIMYTSSVVKINLSPPPSVGPAEKIELKVSPDELMTELSNTSQITVTLKDEGGYPVSNETVEVTATSGQISDVKNNGDGAYSATYTAEKKSGQVTLIATATKAKISKSVTITLISCSVPVFKATLALNKGINMISLPLSPDIPYTASSLADALNATIVIQVEDGHFDAYVHRGSIGDDFDIQMGKGYIVNLMEAQTFELTGKPWGEPIPLAPSINTPEGTWAFVIAGRIKGEIPVGGKLRATNLRTKQSIVAPISPLPSPLPKGVGGCGVRGLSAPSGELTLAFVDMSRQSVVTAGDEIIIQIIGASDTPLTEAKRHIISRQEIAQAYMLTYLSAIPEQSRLLQNYPNPFNPETWIPFQLAQPADVNIHIYNAQGQLIHALSLGQQNAGFYLNRSKAACWNGRNSSGERVASGIYFYQLQAGDFTATRRMVIVK